MRWLAFCIKTVTACILGIIGLSLFIQHDKWYQHQIKERVITFFERSYQCHFITEIESVNLLTGLLTLKDPQACSLTSELWQWKADKIYVHFSYLQALLFKKPIEIAIHINQLEAHSSFKGAYPAIAEHIQLLIKPSAARIPSHVKKFGINHAEVTIHHKQLDLALFFNLINFELYNLAGLSKVLTIIKNGSCSLHQKLLLQNLSGNLHMQLPFTANNTFAPFNLVLQGLAGNNKEESTLTIKTQEKEAVITFALGKGATQLTARLDPSWTLQAHLMASLAHIADLFHQPIPVQGSLEGDITLQQGIVAQCELHCTNNSYGSFSLPNLHIKAQQNGEIIEGTIECTTSESTLLSGTAYWNITKHEVQFTAHNPTELTYSTFHIPVKKLIIACAYPSLILAMHYSVTDNHNKSYEGKGSLFYDNEQLKAELTINSITYQSTLTFSPTLKVCMQIGEGNQQKFFFTTEAYENAKGFIDYSLIHSLLQKNGYDIPGQGTITFKGYPTNEGIKLQWELEKGSLYLSTIANIIQKAYGDIIINFRRRNLTLLNTKIELYKGDISLKQATVQLNSENKITFVCLPITFNNCFISYYKDIFAFISGAVMIKKKNQECSIEGFINVDQGFMHSNMFSLPPTATSPSTPSFNPALDLLIETTNPCIVQTPFLETQATTHFTIQGTRKQPQLSGKIELQKGMLNFPYQPLFITQGTLYFLPTSLNPLLEISARNTIKKYAIDLSLGGTLKNPTINFTSYPALAPEQIITLLLGGSEDGSIFLSMPDVLTHYVEDLLFGPAGNSHKTLQKLKQLFKPLKNVRFVPNFTDKTGRGGVRGSLAIEVNERLRGLIQQNFTLSEDTRLEVEYALSDDTSIRALKDERGDVGAEIEMRWKW